MSESNVDNLKQRLTMIVEAIEGAQSSIRVTEDRVDGALGALSSIADGSGSEALATALGELAQVKSVFEAQLAHLTIAADNVAHYRNTR